METVNKYKYIESAPLDTIVAFTDEKGKARSAAIKERDTENKILKVETEFGRAFSVPYDNVLWVKSGPRFPRGVYNMLKGIKEESSEVE